MALVRFLTDYRSRAWSTRFAAFACVEIDNADLIREVVDAGVATVVAPAEPVAVIETIETIETVSGPEPNDDPVS
jgi:UDP-N-acetylmuramyl pentapeptide synthase